MRSLALDVHLSFCEVAICEQGKVRSAGRVKSERAALELFAESLDPTDQVVMEATGPAMEIARIIEPHVARVVVANAQDVRAISHARVKSDRFDARTLARLLDAGMLEAVWVPDAATQALRRRVARRAALVRQRTRAKNEIHATLARCLLGRPPVSDLFGKGGRAWLARQELPAEEAETVAGCLRQIGFLSEEIGAIDAKLCEWATSSLEARRLMTIPGLGIAAAAALMAAIGDISRFSSSRKLVAYLGLDAKVRQSGEGPAQHGRISKRGNAQARAVLVEAAWIAVRSPGPLRAFSERLRVRKHSGIAAVAVARKIACLCWQLLTKEEDYAFGRPSLVRAKLRRAELNAGAAQLPKRHGARRVSATPQEREAERELVERAEAAYRRLVADWKSTGAKGAGATDGRASSGPSTGQAARQAKAPGPAL
ncbi:MAG TPA: IS110 family transposase [Solirubrobacterales bacterium]